MLTNCATNSMVSTPRLRRVGQNRGVRVASALEYGLIGALIAVGIIAAARGLSPSINKALQSDPPAASQPTK